MQYIDAFSGYHPLVNFLYFGLVLTGTMFFMHPICLFISLLGSISYYIKLHKGTSVRFLLRYICPILLLTAFINPAFNHQGTILLCYLPTGNALTLESILYGIAAAVLLISVLLWFQCYTVVMTSDKFVYLFGRLIPSLSLVLSMTLRFVPRFRAQFAQVREAQAGIGRDTSNGTLWRRLRSAMACFSIMVTYSLENAIETADSMKSRGYGLKGRTAFSIYSFTQRDWYLVLWFSFCGIYLLGGSLSGNLFWRYFPSIRGVLVQPLSVSLELVYLFLCITPLVIDGREERKWKSLQSKI